MTRQATQTVKGARSILQLSWSAVWGILERAVDRGMASKQSKPLPRIGIDEKSFKKGHSYITLIYDVDNSTVETIASGKDEAAANDCFSQLSPEQINSVEAIAIDMSQALVKAAKGNIPLAEEKIVHDRFHVMKLVNEAVDKARKPENRQLVSQGDHSLIGSKYLSLRNYDNVTPERREQLNQLLDAKFDTGKAWTYKEILRDLWHWDTECATSDGAKGNIGILANPTTCSGNFDGEA